MIPSLSVRASCDFSVIKVFIFFYLNVSVTTLPSSCVAQLHMFISETVRLKYHKQNKKYVFLVLRKH